MSIEVQTGDFDPMGNLSLAGMKTFWKEVDRAMKKI